MQCIYLLINCLRENQCQINPLNCLFCHNNIAFATKLLKCISTNTFSDIDIFIYKMFTFRSPVWGAERKHFVNKNIYIGERVC